MAAELCELLDDLRYVRRPLAPGESLRVESHFAWAIVGSVADVVAWIKARGGSPIATARRGERVFLRIARVENDAIGRRLKMEAAMLDAVLGNGISPTYPPAIVAKPRAAIRAARDIVTRSQIQTGCHRELLRNPAGAAEINRFYQWLLTTELHVFLRCGGERGAIRRSPRTFADVYRAAVSAARMPLAR